MSTDTFSGSKPPSKCHGLFTIDPKFHKKSREYVQDIIEHGGNLKVNYHTKQVKENTTVHSKAFNQLEMPNGPFEWHSHPGKCHKGQCTLGLPSVMDLENIFELSFSRPILHLVYAKEGTYVIRVKPEILKDLESKGDDAICAHKCLLKETLMGLHKQYTQSKTKTYKEHRDLWLQKSNELGFFIELFEGDTPPLIRNIEYACEFGLVDSFKEEHIPSNAHKHCKQCKLSHTLSILEKQQKKAIKS
jgi:hypothetical protein